MKKRIMIAALAVAAVFAPVSYTHLDGVPGSQEGAHTLCVLFWYFFRTSEKSAYNSHRLRELNASEQTQINAGNI